MFHNVVLYTSSVRPILTRIKIVSWSASVCLHGDSGEDFQYMRGVGESNGAGRCLQLFKPDVVGKQDHGPHRFAGPEFCYAGGVQGELRSIGLQ